MLIDAYIIRETPKAFLVEWEGDEYWIPKSVCYWEGEQPQDRDTQGELEVEDWFAEKQGWL
jgi:hypothetical protein